MQCPNDQTTLAMTERQGVEIDYCPTCRGVWLDRGELDKLIASSESAGAPMQEHRPQQQHSQPYQDRPRYDDRPKYDDHSSYGGHHKKKRKESFLGDLFDF
ncbi:zf-TFIIB domain-containing protein [bacterium]|nr:MAG: zf-TFIIB domain-containing protein [bacterium]